MKQLIPLLIAATCGIVLIITAFIPATVTWGEVAAVWFDILAAIAFVLGGANLLKIHLQRISEQEEGWAYSGITVVTFLLTLIVGLLKWNVPPNLDQEFLGETFVRVPVERIPESMHYTVPVDLPAELVHHHLPLSSHRQFSVEINESGERITSIGFIGWMTANQKRELTQHHQRLDWQCAIDQLAETASPPPELNGVVRYVPNHRSLSVDGPLAPEGETLLRSQSETADWQKSIDQLAERSRRITQIPATDLPEGFEIPGSILDRVSLGTETIDISGPISQSLKGELIDVFPRSRPMTSEQIDEFIQQLAKLSGGLTEPQTAFVRNSLEGTWTADQLIVVLNEADTPQPGKKSYCDLLAEQLAGGTVLLETIPPSGNATPLNEEQIAALKSVLFDPARSLHEISAALSTAGHFSQAQQSALDEFLGKQPTIGTRNRHLVAGLLSGDQQLSPEQLDFLLASYRDEHNWRERVHAAMLAAHETKYPWSGEYVAVGSPFWWSYEYAFTPLTATMFSLLAFFVASAAFRAFRAKNLDAFLLLGTAFIILLGRTSAAVILTAGLPDSLAFLRIENITMFIMSVINTAGNRAIMIGISLGIVSTSLKVLLGVDRSYLGSGDD